MRAGFDTTYIRNDLLQYELHIINGQISKLDKKIATLTVIQILLALDSYKKKEIILRLTLICKEINDQRIIDIIKRAIGLISEECDSPFECLYDDFLQLKLDGFEINPIIRLIIANPNMTDLAKRLVARRLINYKAEITPLKLISENPESLLRKYLNI